MNSDNLKICDHAVWLQSEEIQNGRQQLLSELKRISPSLKKDVKNYKKVSEALELHNSVRETIHLLKNFEAISFNGSWCGDCNGLNNQLLTLKKNLILISRILDSTDKSNMPTLDVFLSFLKRKTNISL